MDILTLDCETFYDNDYSLSKMTTEAYVRDPRFELILASIKFDDAPADWVLPERFEYFLKNEVDWANTAVIAHHAHFDGLILSHHYGVRPAMWIDTLSMARPLDGPKAGNSLHDLCLRHGIGAKGDYVTYAKGKRGQDFSAAETKQYGDYCCNDADRTYQLAQIFLPQMPMDELKLVDLTVRMFTEPVFQGDVAKLRGAVAGEQARKRGLMERIGLICKECNGEGHARDLLRAPEPWPCKRCDGSGLDKKPLGSNEQFAALLRTAGAEPEMKRSNTTGEMIYAFAKTDPAMQALLEDEDEQVRFLAEARIGVKSNIIETRAERFASAAERGAMPVYISYAGAHTLRWSGGDSMNWQNLSNDNANRPEMAAIKGSVIAPPGHKIVAADSGQGEARVTAWLAGQQDLVEAFAQGRDVYSEHASTIFGRPVDRKRVKADYIAGQLGKVSILGMGFGMGWYKASMELLKGMLGAPAIQFTEADMKALGVDPSRFLNNPKKIERVAAMPSRLELTARLIHCVVTEALVQCYREKCPRITAYRDLMETVIDAMLTGKELVFGAHGVMRTGKECIHLPNGMMLHYRGLERSQDGQASYFNGRERTKLYGGLLVENTVQCLHRLIVAEQMLKISEVLKVALMTHDEVVCVVPEESAEMALQFMVETMKQAPAWAIGLPLIGEGGIGDTLLEAK